MSKRATLNFHQIPEYLSDDEGDSSHITNAHYHEPAPSPAKVQQPEPQHVWDDHHIFDDATAPPVDPAYVHHLGTVDLEPNPRVYTQAVSLIIKNEEGPGSNQLPGYASITLDTRH